MLTGAHVLIFTSNSQADSAFLRDVLDLPHVDAGEGFLIFGLPPAEVAVHDSDGAGGKHELYLICDDIAAFVASMQEKNIACDPITERGWGSVSSITLPSGIKLGVYESHHTRPAAKKKAGKALRKTAKVVAVGDQEGRQEGRQGGEEDAAVDCSNCRDAPAMS